MTVGNKQPPLRILLASSDAPWSLDLDVWLRRHGYAVDRLVTRAADPYDLQASQPDLILLDLQALGGKNLLARLQTLERLTSASCLPVIIIAADAALEFELLDVYDFLLLPLDYNRLLINIRRLEQTPPVQTESTALSDKQWQRYHHYIEQHTGLQFSRRNSALLERGLQRRMCAIGAAGYDAYFTFLTRHADSHNELKKLLSLVTVGETSFFRYKNHRDAFLQHLMPKLIAERRHSRRLRIWSAGCSTGEEPYGISLLLQEHFPQLADWDVQILATDISKRSLRAAREGIYGQRAVRMVDEPYLSRYFTPLGNLFVIDPQLRSRIDFDFLNLKDPCWPSIEPASFDLIFCRNVMIYFDLDTSRKIVDRFADSLRPGGYLLLGHAETLQNVSSRFQRRQFERAFLYQLDDQPPQPQPAATDAPQPPPPAPVTAAATDASRSLRADQMFRRGQAAFQHELFDEAERLYAGALEQKADHQQALVGMGLVRICVGDPDGARLCGERAQAIDDLFPDSYFLLGLAYAGLGHTDRAIQEMERALWLDPGFVTARHALFRYRRMTGDLRAARRELLNVIRCLEQEPPATLVPHSGGLSREQFLENCRNDLSTLPAFS